MQVHTELCTSPEGFPLTPADAMYQLCVGDLDTYTGHAVTIPGRSVSTFEYGEGGELRRVESDCGNPDVFELVFEYGPAGELTRFERTGVVAGDNSEPYTRLVFDHTFEGGRLVGRDQTSVGFSDVPFVWSFEHDEAGRITRYVPAQIAEDPEAGRYYVHDEDGRLASWTWTGSAGQTDSSTFSREGDRIVEIVRTESGGRDSLESSIEWTDGKVASQSIAWPSGLRVDVRLAYDDAGRVVERSGITHEGEPMFAAFREYDDEGRLVRFEWWGYHRAWQYGTDAW